MFGPRAPRAFALSYGLCSRLYSLGLGHGSPNHVNSVQGCLLFINELFKVSVSDQLFQEGFESSAIFSLMPLLIMVGALPVLVLSFWISPHRFGFLEVWLVSYPSKEFVDWLFEDDVNSLPRPILERAWTFLLLFEWTLSSGDSSCCLLGLPNVVFKLGKHLDSRHEIPEADWRIELQIDSFFPFYSVKRDPMAFGALVFMTNQTMNDSGENLYLLDTSNMLSPWLSSSTHVSSFSWKAPISGSPATRILLWRALRHSFGITDPISASRWLLPPSGHQPVAYFICPLAFWAHEVAPLGFDN
ncbi:hypothetical protein Acr_17g0006960 [Actinidia rufa]|uniref:Uncharacterized protein n=1 Tax=Actinidia rufa TaxID=165716 RepID=A0A7J0G2W5_9ERIC|nr:hypothetical protein Acr_17g0006960 [Actinidia rufa]